MNRSLIYIMLSVAFNVAANFTLKAYAARGHKSFIELLMSMPLYVSMAFFGINFLFYTKALQSMNISVAYPLVVGLSVVLILFLSLVILGERLAPAQFAGIALVIAGIVLIYAKM